MSQAALDGYVILPGFLDKRDQTDGVSLFASDGTVDYITLQTYTANILARVGKRLTWSDPDYIKLRPSDANNAKDAGGLHRDVIPINRNANPALPMYTVLLYLDKSTIELVPGSHTSLQNTYWDSARLYTQRKQIDLMPGDVVVLCSTLLHRGVFSMHTSAPNRRLIQIFEVTPDSQTRQLVNRLLHHLPALSDGRSVDVASALMGASKIPILSDALNILSFLNAATGYGISRGISYGASVYLSSEARQTRFVPAQGRWQENNMYVVKAGTVDIVNPSVRGTLQWELFNRQFVSYLAIVTLLVTIIVVCYRKRNQRIYRI